MEVMLLTDDVDNRFKAVRELGLKAESVIEYARSKTDCKELYDIVQRWTTDDAMDIGAFMNDNHIITVIAVMSFSI